MIGTTEAAKRYGGDPHFWRNLCAAGRVKDAQMVGKQWLMPDNPIVYRASGLGRKSVIKMVDRE